MNEILVDAIRIFLFFLLQCVLKLNSRFRVAPSTFEDWGVPSRSSSLLRLRLCSQYSGNRRHHSVEDSLLFRLLATEMWILINQHAFIDSNRLPSRARRSWSGWCALRKRPWIFWDASASFSFLDISAKTTKEDKPVVLLLVWK